MTFKKKKKTFKNSQLISVTVKKLGVSVTMKCNNKVTQLIGKNTRQQSRQNTRQKSNGIVKRRKVQITNCKIKTNWKVGKSAKIL